MPNAPAVVGSHEEVLRELIPASTRRVLDIGTGDGRLIALCRECAPDVEALGLDLSAPMLDRARERFADEPGVTIAEYDLADPLPDYGRFDLVVSGFAIHHVEDEVKRARYAEIFDLLLPEGRFINVEHVSSPSERLHQDFKDALGVEQGDPSNRCSPTDVQLEWLRDIGFTDVDCLWKWRELALLYAHRP